MMTRKKKFSELRDYIVLALAMLVGSIGWVVFLLPNHITLGGLPGISSILYWGFGIPVQVTYLVLNVVLLAFALRILGLKFCIKTIYAVLVFTACVSVLQTLTAGSHLLHDQPFMATVVGACFLGGSVGMGLSCNGSTGGSDVIAAMINKYHDISLGHAILMCDVCVVTSSYFVLGDWEKVIYGYVVLFVSSICVDRVVNMMRRSVQFFIISDKHEEIGHAINLDMMRGCTIINGQGFYSGKEVKMLFVLARQSESSKIFRLIDEIDPTAFVSQSAVIGVYGLGFDRFKGKK
jgi:uncharacterized membrane-anchored protein YitT (DUF2179 family)